MQNFLIDLYLALAAFVQQMSWLVNVQLFFQRQGPWPKHSILRYGQIVELSVADGVLQSQPTATFALRRVHS